MNKRGRIPISLVVLGALLACLWRSQPPSEPIYQGKTLSQWLEGTDTNQGHLIGAPWPNYEIELAVGHMGTNAIPFLLPMIGAHDSTWKNKMFDLFRRQNYVAIKNEKAYSRICKGALGLAGLGTNALPALPELTAIYNSSASSSENREAIIEVLCQIGEPDEQAIPLLVSAISSGDPILRNRGLMAFYFIHGRPELAVPALIKVLNGTNSFDWVYAASALRDYGADAKPAVPDLIRVLAKVAPGDRGFVINALNAIDPAATVKAGIK